MAQEDSGRGPIEAHLKRVVRYYDRTESRIGYEHLMRGKKHFGWYDDGDAIWRFQPALSRMEDELAERMDLPAGARVLDAGCGMGEVARAMATRHGLVVDGIDILDFNLSEARRRSEAKGLSERTQFKWGDYHQVPFEDGIFDGVYTLETLVHAQDSNKVLAEFFRVLRPGGHLVLVEYSRAAKGSISLAGERALESVCDIAAMPSWLDFEPGVLVKKLWAAGFVEVGEEDVTEHVLPMLRMFSLLGRLPYWIGRKINNVGKTVNAMSGVEMYRHQEAWAYNIYTARKPQ